MSKYLLSVYQPEGPTPPRKVLDRIMGELDAVNRDMKAAGAWVFSGGLHAQSTATVVRVKDDEVLMTDGPFAEAKEYLGGFTIVDVPDLDAALGWATRIARASTLPIEVRPFHEVRR